MYIHVNVVQQTDMTHFLILSGKKGLQTKHKSHFGGLGITNIIQKEKLELTQYIVQLYIINITNITWGNARVSDL